MKADKKIIFISGYNRDEKNINGYMQLFSEYEKDQKFDIDFFKVDKVWYKKDIKNFFDKSIKIYFPLSKLDFNETLKNIFISFPKINYSPDILFFDSDPYSILIHKQIINYFKPKYIIYRQSDPMVFIDKKGIISKNEISLMNIADQIWVTNKPRKDKIEKFNPNNVYILENPIKLNINSNYDLLNSDWILKVNTLKNIYTKIGLYYGKLSIDYDLVIKTALKTQETAYIIVGDYITDKKLPKNIYLVPFKPIDEITEVLKLSDFLFVPYNINDNSELLHLTSKLLLASYLKKPIIAQGVNEGLMDFNIYVGQGSEFFIDKIKYLNTLELPKINLAIYTEEYFYKSSLAYLDLLQK